MLELTRFCFAFLVLPPGRVPELCGAQRQQPTAMLLAPKDASSLETRTVQDGKDDFQRHWGEGFVGGWGENTAPLPMSTQTFVNEMITTVTIALASPNYQYSPAFGLGFQTLIGYYSLEIRSEKQREKMRIALAKALLTDPAQMEEDATSLLAAAEGLSEEELFETAEFKRLAGLNSQFKYTYIFGVGLLTLMQKVGVDPATGVKSWCDKLNLACENQFTRDASYFKAQMSKLELMQEMFAQMKAASEKAATQAAEDKAAGIETKDPRKITNTK